MELLSSGAWGAQLVALFEQYGVWIVFIGTFLTGEIVILASFMLAVQGWFTLESVFVLTVLATICADLFWFTVGRFFPQYLQKLKTFQSTPNIPFLNQALGNQQIAWILLVAKFLYGFRWITIIYLTMRGIRFTTFVILDFLGIVLFIGVLATLGILAGKGIYNPIPAYEKITTVLSVLVFTVVILIVMRFAVAYVKRLWITMK